MKIVLINPLKFQENLVKRNEVVSLTYLKQFLGNYGYNADILELKMEEEVSRNELELWGIKKYDVIGISCYYPFNPLDLATYIKKINSNALIVAGGPMASLLYKELLFEKSPIDAVIINEGEWSLLELIQCFDYKRNVKNIQGVAIYNNGKIDFSRRMFENELDKFSYPYREKGYFKRFIPTLISSRGCNGRCTFCSTRYTGNWRGRSPRNVYSEIQHIVIEHGEKHFQFVEPNFLHDGKRAVEITEYIMQLPCDVTFDFACRIDSILQHKESIQQLKKAGAIKVLLGVENFSDSILKKWKKDVRCNQIEEALSILKKNKLAFSISLILFYPEVSLEELIFNIKEIEKLEIIYYIENLYNALILIPGTQMNMSTQKKEWKFLSKEVEDIYRECMRFREELNDIMNCFDILKSEYKLLFETNAYYKKYELNKLKQLLNLPTKKAQISKESIFYLNPRIAVEKEQEMYHCINEETGIVIQIDENIEKMMDYIKDKNIFSVIDDIGEISGEYKLQKSIILEWICFLLRNRIVLIGDKVDEEVHNK